MQNWNHRSGASDKRKRRGSQQVRGGGSAL